MFGYSGGAIATDWAAQLAPSYAPDVNRQLVGAAEGGVLVDPAHNLTYVDGSSIWAGIIPMSIIGIARGFGINIKPYLSSYGLQLYNSLQNASIANVLGQYPGLTFARLVKPRYANPASIPVLVKVENELNTGSLASPTIPMFIGQGADGTLEGTPGNKPGIGRGDGVMVAGDVRTLARDFCASGTAVDYTQYNTLSHVSTFPVWAPAALTWLNSRFAGSQAPNDCSQIPPGNSLAPVRPAG
jgi:secretory lipase